MLGSFEQLLKLAEEQLGLNRKSMKVSENETKKTIQTEQVILNWFYSRGTLQAQGPQAANFKGFLTKLLGAESNNENAILRPSQHSASSQEANFTLADNPETERFLHKTVPFSVFTEEIKNIWSEVKAIREKLVEPHQLKENEEERNGNQEIQTLRQKNQDLQNEICMLKDQLREQNNMLTLTLNKAVGQLNKTRGVTEEARGAPSRHPMQKIHILVLITKTSMQENQ